MERKRRKKENFFAEAGSPVKETMLQPKLLDDCLHGKRNGRMEQVGEANRMFLFCHVDGS